MANLAYKNTEETPQKPLNEAKKRQQPVWMLLIYLSIFHFCYFDSGTNHFSIKENHHAAVAYNDADRITQISTSDGQNFGYSYSAAGEVLGKTRPNGVNEANTFNELGRLVSIADTLNSKNLLTLNYQYDNEGNKLSEIKSFPGLTGESSVGKLYQYDNLYRLKGEKVIDPSAYAGVPTFDNAPTFTQLTNLDLDLMGNRKTVRKQDGTGAVISEEKYNTSGGVYVPDPTSKINTVETQGLASLQHDLNGNITDDGKNTYVFDAENKLLEVRSKSSGSIIANYFYDAEGRRIRKSVSFPGLTGESIFLYSGNQLVEEHSSAGSTWNVHGLGIDDVNRITKNGVNLYPLTNDQGSVYAVTDASGNVLQRYDYSPYGKVTVQDANGVILSDSEESTPLVNRLYQGRELDQETGLYFYRARYYSPELGRFISHDPLGFVDGMNMYEFVRGNPGTYTDPYGRNAAAVDILEEVAKNVQALGPYGKLAATAAIAAAVVVKYGEKVGEAIGDAVYGNKDGSAEGKQESIADKGSEGDKQQKQEAQNKVMKEMAGGSGGTRNPDPEDFDKENKSKNEGKKESGEKVKAQTEKESDQKSEKSIEEKRLTKAKNFYKKSGYSDEATEAHTQGIDKSKPVSIQTIKKGTQLSQYQRPDRPQGNYYSRLEADPNKMGINPEGRVMKTYEATRDVKVLKSNTGDIEFKWEPGVIRKGGEVQYFTAEKDAFELIQ